MEYTCTIELEGETTEDLEIAIDEVKRLLSEGYFSGFNSNENGSYSFSMKNKEIRENEGKHE